MASLPQELVNSIVDQLDDYSSLTSCALVSTSFVAPAQQAIFKSLCIHTELSHRHPTPLAASDSLAAFPHLAAYIRLLEFDLSHLESEIQALESIFLAVRNLERLIISGSGMQWSSVPSALKIGIQNIIAFPSLYGLHLVAIHNLPSDFIYHAASSVSVLSTCRVSMEQNSEQPRYPFPDLRLTHLILSDSGWRAKNICDLFLPAAPSHTPRLERLSILMDSECRISDSKLLSAIAPSLRHLSLRIYKARSAMDIPQLPLVRTLEVKLIVDPHSPEVPPSLSKIATTFPNIELLTVVFILKPHDQPPSPSLFAGTLLSFPARTQFPHLRQVHCQLLPRYRRHDLSVVFAYFCTTMDEQLSSLRGTGILRRQAKTTSHLPTPPRMVRTTDHRAPADRPRASAARHHVDAVPRSPTYSITPPKAPDRAIALQGMRTDEEKRRAEQK
ncbi:hypothetical protein C8J57DRAFT_1515330 [Mycena rebaudengoi]|nr:hypothetical protein C8J57DRAFT_1515330 [Mycena rebaudengoi]